MKTKRITLRDGDIFKFDPHKRAFFEVYYNHSYVIDGGEFKFIVGFMAGNIPPKELIITLIYLDTSKKCSPIENLEYLEKITIVPAQYKPGKNEFTTQLISISDGSKKLWKVRLEAIPLTKCNIILSFYLF
ncbi:hypothetical protein BH11BAC7_BH11BAC7_26240 [soil metagenome]